MKKKSRRLGRPSAGIQDEKRRHLIQEARKELLRTEGTDFRLNQVLKSAGGSKATLYSYFKNRDGLLEAVLQQTVEETLPSEAPMSSASPEEILTRIGVATYKAVLSPETLALYRMAVTEIQGASSLAESFYENGPAVARKIFCRLLEDFHKRKILKVDNIPLASELFFGMLLEGPLLRKMLKLEGTAEALHARAQYVAKAFLKIFA